MTTTSLGKPAARRSALPAPADPLHSFLGFLFAGRANGNGCGWLDNFENDIEFGVLADDLEAEFPGIPGGGLALDTTTAILANNVVAAGAPSERGAEAASEPTRNPADDSSSEEDDDDVGDPCFHPKAKKRVRGGAVVTMRPRPAQKQQQRGPTGQWKPKSVSPPAPLVAVVVVEEGARRCRECGTTQTTQWRAGPGGPNRLCNACGLRWKKQNAKRQPAAKASHAKQSKNNLYALRLDGEGEVARKQRIVPPSS
ncbi:hypothetical protein QOZ80_5AG0370600 [Eleusine coracana subsp. coracana]|nr:hypothetical protein QOZ80_5AG0370600 [Eleusine coracana subsp. coracana]